MRHGRPLYAVAVRMTRNPAEAEDLVQDTLVKAFRARDRFEAGTHMRSWLLRILTNTFIHRYHRGGRERRLLEGPDSATLTDGWIGAETLRSMRDPESLALRPRFEREVAAALDELPEDFRMAVVLADVEEMSYKEIAEIMGCPVGTVMSRLHRGRRLLKERLREQARAIGIVAAEPAPPSGAEVVPLERFRRRGGGA
ncbi:MAG: sigma-70 family RNA polymerase sigma factor [Polyangiaceae bacterium]|nr:sigma-70 family RNA polymerase sigma factor [Polyangiaceae bacterium]